MSAIADRPVRHDRNQSFTRSERMFDVVRSCRNGGSAMMMQDRYTDLYCDSICLDTVKRALAHLVRLGVIKEEVNSDGRWYSRIQPAGGETR